MSIYVFSSKNLTNIWAGIGAKLWAVSEAAPTTHQQRITGSKAMSVGSCGIFYCSETKSLTTPFLVYSKPDPKSEVQNVWSKKWVLPFRIHPLGTPNKQLYKDTAMKVLLSLRASGKTNIGHVLNIQAVTVFAPSRLTEEDWELIIRELAEHTEFA